MLFRSGSIPAGCSGVTLIPELFPGGFSGKLGGINGFTHETTRSHMYRAALEAISYYTLYGLERLQKVGNYKAQDVICVGGGSRNPLWNQIRADVLGIPLKALDMKETTALGAAMTAFIGIGVYKNIQEAFEAIESRFEEYQPGVEMKKYQELYSKFVEKVF